MNDRWLLNLFSVAEKLRKPLTNYIKIRSKLALTIYITKTFLLEMQVRRREYLMKSRAESLICGQKTKRLSFEQISFFFCNYYYYFLNSLCLSFVHFLMCKHQQHLRRTELKFYLCHFKASGKY